MQGGGRRNHRPHGSGRRWHGGSGARSAPHPCCRAEIAEASYDAEKFRQAWGVILQRFECEPPQWRRVYKV